LFDRLRLREPFAEAFNALGFEGEEGWRVAARMKVVLLVEAGVGQPEKAPATDAAVAEVVAEQPAESLPVSRTVAPSKAPEEPAEKRSHVSGDDLSSAESAAKSAGPLGPAALWPALWSDPDVRWLTGVHEAEGHSYLVREQYEELLWWLQVPSLLHLAAETRPSPAAVAAVSQLIEDSLATAEAAGYRVDLLSGALEPAGEPPAKANPDPAS
jgi:hypothetical protein